MRKDDEVLLKLFSSIGGKSRLYISPCSNIEELIQVVSKELHEIGLSNIIEEVITQINKNLNDFELEYNFGNIAIVEYKEYSVAVDLSQRYKQKIKNSTK